MLDYDLLCVFLAYQVLPGKWKHTEKVIGKEYTKNNAEAKCTAADYKIEYVPSFRKVYP